MRPIGAANKVVRPPWQTNDPYFIELLERMDGCSEVRGGCENCPHRAKCERWLAIIAGRLCDTKMRATDYETYLAEFERIRGNGDKPLMIGKRKYS